MRGRGDSARTCGVHAESAKNDGPVEPQPRRGISLANDVGFSPCKAEILKFPKAFLSWLSMLVVLPPARSVGGIYKFLPTSLTLLL